MNLTLGMLGKPLLFRGVCGLLVSNKSWLYSVLFLLLTVCCLFYIVTFCHILYVVFYKGILLSVKFGLNQKCGSIFG